MRESNYSHRPFILDLLANHLLDCSNGPQNIYENEEVNWNQIIYGFNGLETITGEQFDLLLNARSILYLPDVQV